MWLIYVCIFLCNPQLVQTSPEYTKSKGSHWAQRFFLIAQYHFIFWRAALLACSEPKITCESAQFRSKY